nr:immunoglobulin heavy chain junction region [Macaca mulatta]
CTRGNIAASGIDYW